MEKRKLSGKTILKLVGALLALAYLGFCLYAGITGKFPNMHRVEHVMPCVLLLRSMTSISRRDAKNHFYHFFSP